MPRSFRRVAALYDIHGNLPALDAVLEQVRAAGVDLIVVGGDVVPGPMPREALERLLGLELPVRFLHGNCELAVLAQLEVDDAMRASYWGSASGRPLGETYAQGMRWSALQVADHRDFIASWPRTLRFAIDGMGEVLFCHSTPRSETEIFTCRTSEERLRPVFDGLGVGTVICGHTHMPFDRVVGSTRVINAGSVGMPFGDPGASGCSSGRMPCSSTRRTTSPPLRNASVRCRTPRRRRMPRRSYSRRARTRCSTFTPRPSSNS